ncbi:MAG TPA: BPTI/Kunitz domain-containing protein [Polyangiaceae bacterium]|nr:BPTI/Kunitz domain-containing protein [Polyangiaceae bacterium]
MTFARILTGVASTLALAVSCGGATDVGTGTAAAWAACSANSDCTLSANTCCGVCGAPELADVDAVNGARVDEHFRAVCPKPVPCPKCGTAENPNLLATCTGGACRAVDVRNEHLAACRANSDCRLRVTGCCECGGSTASAALIAIAVTEEAAYAALVCDPGTGCPACAPVYPKDVEAYCASDGHCDVRPATADACSLPFDPGPCDAAFHVFASVNGVCVPETYGGCGGNENRFSTIEECLATCAGAPDPNGCPTGRSARAVCLECGPAGGCSRMENVCAMPCGSSTDCDPSVGFCGNGFCQVGACD